MLTLHRVTPYLMRRPHSTRVPNCMLRISVHASSQLFTYKMPEGPEAIEAAVREIMPPPGLIPPPEGPTGPEAPEAEGPTGPEQAAPEATTGEATESTTGQAREATTGAYGPTDQPGSEVSTGEAGP